MCYIHTIEYSTIKRNEVLIHSITCMNYENMLSKSQSQKVHDPIYMKHLKQANQHKVDQWTFRA